jgi:hypothetical protein
MISKSRHGTHNELRWAGCGPRVMFFSGLIYSVVRGLRLHRFHVNKSLLEDAAGSPKRNATRRISAAGQRNLLKFCHAHRSIR